jgi:manganese transport protein
MYLDALLSMVVYTIVTAAFFVLGAAVLNARGEVPDNKNLIPALATMYTESLGPWAWGVFMVGAFFVLFSTLFSALGAWTRTFADAGGHLGLYNFADQRTRRRAIVALAWFFPMAWAAAYLLYEDSPRMVLVGGVGTSIMLIVVMIGAVDFRYRRTAPELRPSRLYDAALWTSISSITAFLAFGGWTGVQKWFESSP